MNFPNKQIKSSELLIEAKRTIEPWRRFICNEVCRAAQRLTGNFNHPKALRIGKQIQADLDATNKAGRRDYPYGTWYADNYGKLLSIREEFEARHQWLAALIEYYQKQGD